VGSESGFPSGITSGGFSPTTIVGSGTATLTVNTTTATVPYALSLTVTGTSGSTSHTASTTLLVTLATPASLAASGGDSQASLSWAGSVGASGYHLKRATTNGGPYVPIACPTSTSYVDTGLSDGTTYFYVVSAAYTGGPDSGGESADSSQASVTPQAPVPPAPGGLTATAGNAQVALSWNASTGATGYRVKRSTTSGGPYNVVGSPSTTGFTDTGLTNGTPYFYVVSAVNSAGESSNSSQVSATPQGTPPASPSGLTVKATKPRRLMLQWVQSPTAGVTQNGVYRRTSGGSYPTSPTAKISATTAYSDDGLTSGTGYCYRVTAFTAIGESAPSAESCGTPK
jgi:cellulose 1,4-beta-cellobiosidase